MGLDEDQVNVLKRCFDGFADEDGAIPAENVGNILSMMGLKVNESEKIIEHFGLIVSKNLLWQLLGKYS